MRLPKTIVIAALCAVTALPARAQRDTSHAGHQMDMPGVAMPSPLLDLSMKRMGSGTTWVPEAFPLPSLHTMAGPWSVMAHGFAFVQYNHQDGPRGDSQFGSLNWGMLMASRPLAGGRFEARTMLSADALTVSGRGYPLLLQSGEQYQGAAIRDRQHPHDFWMELAALYERPLSERIGLSVYAAPSGEPALGPVAFMHRPSAMDNPFAPIGHHWQDATHVAFGVATLGVFGERWKIEGSAFNGREPDEHRWNFDIATMDSWSGRLTVNPNERWSLTAGYGRIAHPEATHPDDDVERITASAMRSGQIGSRGVWAATAIFGANHAHESWTGSLLVEGEAVVDDRHTLFARVEQVEKTGEELQLEADGVASESRFGVTALTAGYVREILSGRGTTLGIGASGTLNMVPPALRPAYGSRTPWAAAVFLRVRVRSATGGSQGMRGHSQAAPMRR
jgi:hypothetical protein